MINALGLADIMTHIGIFCNALLAVTWACLHKLDHFTHWLDGTHLA